MNKPRTHGILMAAGTGSRLHPLTKSVSKHLLPIFDKPMIYYSLSCFALAGVSTVSIVVNARDLEAYKLLLGDGEQFGMNLDFVLQEKPKGILDCFRVVRKRECDRVMLVLGDNFLFGSGLASFFQLAIRCEEAVIFTTPVNNPQDYGVARIVNEKIVEMVEKPKIYISDNAIIGIYIFPGDAWAKSVGVTPSLRGELEIVDLLDIYRNEARLVAKNLGRGCVWIDAGSAENLLKASTFVESIQSRQNKIIGCLEEIALSNGWITPDHIVAKMSLYNSDSVYSKYVKELVNA